MLTANGSIHRQHFGVKISRELLHPFDVIGVRQVEERSNVQLTVPRMGKHRCGNLVLLQHVLELNREIGQLQRRHRNVFDKREWPRGTFQAIERRHHSPRKIPVQFDVICLNRQSRIECELLPTPDNRGQMVQVVSNFTDVASDFLNNQDRFGVDRQQSGVPRVRLDRQTKQSPIHQVASGDTMFLDLNGGDRRFLQLVEQQNH